MSLHEAFGDEEDTWASFLSDTNSAEPGEAGDCEADHHQASHDAQRPVSTG